MHARNAFLLIDVEPQYVGHRSYFGSLFGPFVQAVESRGHHVVRVGHDTSQHPKHRVGHICSARNYKKIEDPARPLERIFCHTPPNPENIVLMKRDFSAFSGTDLHDHLRTCGMTSVTLLGVLGDKKRNSRIEDYGKPFNPGYCIDATAADALRLGYDVSFIPDLIWPEKDEMDGSILTEKFPGTICIASADLLEQIQREPRAPSNMPEMAAQL